MIGWRYALSTVVEKRSNSRYSATTSAEPDTGKLGYRPFAAPLEDGIGADGRAVDEPPHVAPGDAERAEAGQDGGGLVEWLGRHFGDDDAAGGLVDRGQIGEGAADIDPDDEHARDDSIRQNAGGATHGHERRGDQTSLDAQDPGPPLARRRRARDRAGRGRLGLDRAG